MHQFSFHKQLLLRAPVRPVDMDFTIDTLISLMNDASFIESIYIASPVLYAECCKWKTAPDLIKTSRERKLFISLAKYYMRMTTRSTPFGLFSGCSLTVWENHASPQSSRSIFKRRTRLDMHCVCLLSEWIARKPYIKKNLTYHFNSSMYQAGQGLRFIEYIYSKGTRKYQLSSVILNDYLQSLVKTAKSGSSYEKLCKQLLDFNINKVDAVEYIDELIESQLLISNLEQAITNGDPLQNLLNTLKSIRDIEPDAQTELNILVLELERIQTMISKLDRSSVNDVAVYEMIAAQLAKFELAFESGKLFQVDLVTGNAPQGLPSSLQKKLLEAIEVCVFLTNSHPPKRLQIFQQEFLNRYGTEEKLLAEVLDEECGIGYANKESKIAQEVSLEHAQPVDKHANSLQWTAVTQFLLDKTMKATIEGKQYIDITYEETKALETLSSVVLPPSMAIIFRYSSQTDGNTCLYFERATGASCLNMLARFASADKAIAQWCLDLADLEEKHNPDVCFAEIVHLPERRAGNVLLHPAFRKHEIPYLASSALPKEQQTAVADLMISVNAGKLILRDKRTNKQLIPRLSSAHNYKLHALPVYEFLGDLQHQQLNPQISFSWGSLEQVLYFFPRVCYQNIILSPARWKLRQVHFASLQKDTETDQQEKINRFVASWKLPVSFLLCDGDNQLPVYTNNHLSVAAFLDAIKSRSTILLQEFPCGYENDLSPEINTSVTQQYIAAIIQETQVYQNNLQPSINIGKESRNFIPASEWLYYKLYCSEKQANRLLVTMILPFIAEIRQKNLADKWFFIRYNDPDFHIRLRFHSGDFCCIPEIIALVKEKLDNPVQSPGFWKIQIDTYSRELERYGHSTMINAETIFCIDSEAVLSMLQHKQSIADPNFSSLWLLKAIDDMLEAFSISLHNKQQLLQTMRSNFAREFAAGKITNKQLDTNWRAIKQHVEVLLQYGRAAWPKDVFDPLIERYTSLSVEAAKLQEMQIQNLLEKNIEDLLRSFIHMTCNRIFTSQPRKQEFFVYDFLLRYYRSQIARIQTAT